MKRRFLVTVETLDTIVRGKVTPLGKGKVRELIYARLERRPFTDVKVAYAPDPAAPKKAKPARFGPVRRA